jgi:hypothetical protein
VRYPDFDRQTRRFLCDVFDLDAGELASIPLDFPDEARIWAIVNEDPYAGRYLVHHFRKGPPPDWNDPVHYRSSSGNRAARIQAYRRLRPKLAPVDLNTAWGLDPTFFDFGAGTSHIIATIRRARRLTPSEVQALGETGPTAELVARTLTRLSMVTATTLRMAVRLAIGHWASVLLQRTVLIAAAVGADPSTPLETAAADEAARFEGITRAEPGITRWDPLPGWKPPTGHPVPLYDDFDLGPNRIAFRRFYRRSGHLSGAEIAALVNGSREWELHNAFADEEPLPGQVDEPGDALERAGSARPTAYSFARLLGHMGLPIDARQEIKSAGATIALQDLLTPNGVEANLRLWRSVIRDV